MSIFDISEKTDFLFDKLWRVWPQSWSELGEKWADVATQRILNQMAIDADMWQHDLCYAAAATQVWDGVLPDQLKTIESTIVKFANLIRSLFPEYPYMSIRVGSNISGGGIFYPNIEVRLDTEYFGFDPESEPWKTKYSRICFHVGHRPEIYYKNPDGTPGLPYPKAKDWINVPKHNYGGKRLRDEYFFFPENDPPKGWRGVNLTSELLKFQSQPTIF